MALRSITSAACGAAFAALAACGPVCAQGTAGAPPAALPQQQAVVPAAPAHGPIPSKSETAMEAYGKLNRNHAGYLTWDDVRHLEGFETAFQQADQNHDGRLSPAEFNSAWAMYTGNNP